MHSGLSQKCTASPAGNINDRQSPSTRYSNAVEETVSQILNQNTQDSRNDLYMQYLNNAFQQPFAPIIWKTMTGKEIYEITKNLKWKKSFGYDEVPSWIVKLSIPFISSLIFIINKMLSSGVFPAHLKFSHISPIFKKGNKTEISAYRPVSLLTSFSKIFEKVIYNKLLQHAQVNIITMDQYGFINNSSTELAMFKLTNQILTNINKKDAVCGIFCDVSKAFDTLNHEILISKL